MGLMRWAAAGALGYFAFRTWQRYQAMPTDVPEDDALDAAGADAWITMHPEAILDGATPPDTVSATAHATP